MRWQVSRPTGPVALKLVAALDPIRFVQRCLRRHSYRRGPVCWKLLKQLGHQFLISVRMKPQPFDRSKHVYKNDAFVELVKDAVRFFNGTPVRELPPAESFFGTGVYALYYTGRMGVYAGYGELNRLAYGHPIYVGKAVPKGWRQARVADDPASQSRELFSRLREHSRSISVAADLNIKDFMCRFMIFQDAGSDMIGTIEAALIKIHRPLWNTSLDGFGNHDPGSGRYNQAKSDWDVVHIGRSWAVKCQGVPKELKVVKANIARHFKSLD